MVISSSKEHTGENNAAVPNDKKSLQTALWPHLEIISTIENTFNELWKWMYRPIYVSKNDLPYSQIADLMQLANFSSDARSECFDQCQILDIFRFG